MRRRCYISRRTREGNGQAGGGDRRCLKGEGFERDRRWFGMVRIRIRIEGEWG
jgi:hypothetical protein